ncbi:hypothetical protein Tsubulata_015740 [Turnera subulata]|uniref:DUF4283 domain-containing protein n=1 Tax=Turnera subulata TaxID=218843 RepID=A0A9Q0F8Q8_9ROSI|nr:hypothetical protein Tsubulata_015740 [Turnera subulata]
MYVFHFLSVAEKERFLRGSPWTFCGHPLFLQEWPASVALASMEVEDARIWVQIFGLTPNQMTWKKAVTITSLFAGVDTIELPPDSSPHWREFIKMKESHVERVAQDAQQPIYAAFGEAGGQPSGSMP